MTPIDPRDTELQAEFLRFVFRGCLIIAAVCLALSAAAAGLHSLPDAPMPADEVAGR